MGLHYYGSIAEGFVACGLAARFSSLVCSVGTRSPLSPIFRWEWCADGGDTCAQPFTLQRELALCIVIDVLGHMPILKTFKSMSTNDLNTLALRMRGPRLFVLLSSLPSPSTWPIIFISKRRPKVWHLHFPVSGRSRFPQEPSSWNMMYRT